MLQCSSPTKKQPFAFAMANHARKRLVPSGLLALLIVASSTDAFAPSFPPSRSSWHRASPPSLALLGTGADDDNGAVPDCECASPAAVVSGSPSALARAVDVRGVLSSSSTARVYRLDGSPTHASDLLAPADGGGGTSLLVLTRSFG